MGVEMAEKMKEYTFIVRFSEDEKDRFEAFVDKSGMKKRAIAKKGIMRFVEENSSIAQK